MEKQMSVDINDLLAIVTRQRDEALSAAAMYAARAIGLERELAEIKKETAAPIITPVPVVAKS